MERICRDTKKIISRHNRCIKTGTKAGAKTELNTSTKAPRNRYHHSMREQLDKMAEEGLRNYQSIVSQRWEETKEDPKRMIEFNNRTRQMGDTRETEKQRKSNFLNQEMINMTKK